MSNSICICIACFKALQTFSLDRTGKTYASVNLDRIQSWINQGRLKSSKEQPITARDLLLSGCIHQVHDGVKVLGDVRSSRSNLFAA